jgi:hypothetical protein
VAGVSRVRRWVPSTSYPIRVYTVDRGKQIEVATPQSVAELEAGYRQATDEAQQADLATAVAGPAPDGGLWSRAKVAAWISARIGRRVGVVRGWEYLQRLRLRPLVPRPQHQQADSEQQDTLQKTVS